MGLEAGNTIDGLDETWPLSGDNLSQADDHLRLLKAVLKNIFAGTGGNGFAIPITATEAEINLLDGVTASTAEINALDIVASGAAEALKAMVLDASKDIDGINSLTAAFLVGALTGNVTGNLTGNVIGNVTGDLTGDVTGNADTVTTNANLTGDVTSVGNVTNIADLARSKRADPGRLVHISTATLSASASAEFTDLDGTYDSYMIVVKNLYSTDTSPLYMRTSTDNGATFDTTNYDFHMQDVSAGSTSYSGQASSSTSLMRFIPATSTSSSSPSQAIINLTGIGSAKHTKIHGTSMGAALGGVFIGSRTVTETVNAIQILNGGNLTGEIILYGIDKP